MTKIDTKEWLEASNEYTLDDYERAFAFMCKSYDEAQKEIERLGERMTTKHGKSQAQINIPIQILKDKICNLETDLVFKNQRISTLEGLLSEILNVEFWGSQCSVCGMPKQILGDGLNIQNHKSNCLFKRIEKELGE